MLFGSTPTPPRASLLEYTMGPRELHKDKPYLLLWDRNGDVYGKSHKYDTLHKRLLSFGRIDIP